MPCMKRLGLFARLFSDSPARWALFLAVALLCMARSYSVLSQPVPIWATFTSENSGLPTNGIRALALGADGALWVGTEGGGLSQLDKDGQWRSYTKASTKGGL